MSFASSETLDLMPDLDATLHVKMARPKKKRRLLPRIIGAIKRELASPNIYGLQWGDPDVVRPLRFIRDRYVLPYVSPEHTAVEIGPGGGRWTRYLLDFKKLYVVDYHAELLAELKKNFREPRMEFIKNNGTDFPGIAEHSIDYLFSFGVFVHLDAPIIETYLANMKMILKPGANAVIQYSDKNKIMAQLNESFSQNTPEKMRTMVLNAGDTILEEDLTTMWHSSVIRFTV
jgi:SAM-dependent methyltransferase